MKSVLFVIMLVFAFASANAQKQVTTFRVKTPILIDGIIDTYNFSDSATSFIQLEPQKGIAASRRTVVYFGYDSLNIYIFWKCYQPSDEIVAKIQSRDQLEKSDDLVLVMLDTYNDNTSAYGFAVNPLGSQIDLKFTDDGRNMDINWDTEWQSAVKIFSWGWTVEMAIPFKSLKYKKNLNQWGINFGRIIRSNSETSYWSGEMNKDFRISQSGVLAGIETPGAKSNITLFPYSTLRYENSDFSGKYNEVIPAVGGDLQWQFSSNISANATYNPDFATVEADEEQINLSRYELSYPEKRLFFQEGNEMYRTRIRTFYSRRIGDIDWGGKVTGKIGDYGFNVLAAHSPEIADEDQPGAFFTAARVKKDILKSSTIGLTLVDKSWDGGYARSLSADYTLNLGKTWKLTGQLVGSWPGDFKTHSAWFMRFARESNVYHFHFRYTNIGENFMDNMNQTGFVRDDDRREIDSDLEYTWWLQNNIFNYIEVLSVNNLFWSHTGTLKSWYFYDIIKFYFQNRISLKYTYNNEFKLFDKKYYNHKHTLTLGYNTDEWSSAQASYTFGRNFDRDFLLASGSARMKFSKKLAFEYSANYLKFSPDTTNQSAFINIISLNYNFTKDLWIKLFAQNNTNDNRFYIYGLFGWRFKPPFGAIYLIYTRNEMKLVPDNIYQNSDIIFLKLTYPISITR